MHRRLGAAGAPAQIMGRLFFAVSRYKQSLLCLPYHECNTTNRRQSIVIVDDHPVLCDGLRQLIDKQLDLTCAGVADNTSDAKRLVENANPDLMVLDLRLKGGDSLDLIKTLRVEFPEAKVLVLSQYDELIFAERTLRAGAFGYIMKENVTDEVLRAVRKVLSVANCTLANESPQP